MKVRDESTIESSSYQRAGPNFVVRCNNSKLMGRRSHQYSRIPIKALDNAVQFGRAKYRAIICIVWMSMLWDGWKPKKGSKRIRTEKVLFTRRMMKSLFNYSEGTIRRGIDDLKESNLIQVATLGFYNGKENSGTYYKLKWMPGKGSKKINVYWGLLTSPAFLGISITLQAILLMLHTIHYRKQNRLTIKPTSLESFKVCRTKLPGYINSLLHAGLLELEDINTYSFTWIDEDGKPNFDRLNF